MIVIGSLLLSGVFGGFMLYKNLDKVAYKLLFIYSNIESNFTYNNDTQSEFYSIDLLQKKIIKTEFIEPLTLCFKNNKIYFYNEPNNYLDIEFAYVDITIKIKDKLLVENFEITDFFNKIQIHIDNPVSFKNSLLWYLILTKFTDIKRKFSNDYLIDAIQKIDQDILSLTYNIIDMEGIEYSLEKFVLKVKDNTIKIIE